MPENHLDIAIINTVVAQLASVKPVDESDRNEINSVMAGLLRIISRRNDALPSVAQKAAQDESAIVHPDETEGLQPFEFAAMALSEAVVAYLTTLDPKDAQSTSSLVKAVSKHGYQFQGAHPNASATAALRRREKGIGDIVQVGRGKWGLKEWYTQREITAFQHSERTKAGQDAARARGTLKAKSWKLNADQAAEFKRLADEGMPNSHLATVFGIAVGSAANYKKKLRHWKPGDPYPPKEEKTDRPDLRAVK